MLVAACLGLGTRLVTELTVYMPRYRARLRPWPPYGNDNLVRGVVKTRTRAISARHPGYVYMYYYYSYHCTIEI